MARLGRGFPARPILKRALPAVAGDVTVALTGVSAAAAIGTLGVALALGLTGVAAAGSVGSVTSSRTVAVTGVAAAGSAGSVVPSTTLGVTGVAATGAVGTVSAGGDVTRALTGVSATGAAGSLTPALTGPLTGVAATGAVGNVLAMIGGEGDTFLGGPLHTWSAAWVSGNTIAVTLGGGEMPAAGNFLVLTFANGVGALISSIAGNDSNSAWTLSKHVAGFDGQDVASIYHLFNADGSTPTITITLTSTPAGGSDITATVLEFDGMPASGSALVTGSVANVSAFPQTGTLTTANQNTIVVATAHHNDGSKLATPAGFTGVDATTKHFTAWRRNASAAFSQNVAWQTASNSLYACVGVIWAVPAAPNLVLTLGGVSATGAVGDVTPVIPAGATLTGVSGTGATGTVTTAVTVPMTGVAGTGAVGAVGARPTVLLGGVSALGRAGTVTSSGGTGPTIVSAPTAPSMSRIRRDSPLRAGPRKSYRRR